jgi:4-diphosphocytidyl-2-C-methyl-D-erythritol kinase
MQVTHAALRSLHGCPAPAKLNLFLHVVGRRSDGYHLLQSVFQLIDLLDTLDFDLRDDDRIVRTSVIAEVAEADDLVVRAANLLKAEAAVRGHTVCGVDIALKKRIPMGGGLGGGSSDAATVLLVLNHLWQLHLPRPDLMRLGLQLGADVPFFLCGQNAFVEGIGEELTPVVTPPGWYVVIHPGIGVPTKSVFGAAELTRNTKVVKMADFSARPLGFGKNDLQAVVVSAFPAVADALHWLSHRSEARMSGSGACVFARFETESEAESTLSELPAHWRGWKVRSLDHHPLELQL